MKRSAAALYANAIVWCVVGLTAQIDELLHFAVVLALMGVGFDLLSDHGDGPL